MMQFKKAKAITVPYVPWVLGTEYTLQFTSAIELSKPAQSSNPVKQKIIEQAVADGTSKRPPEIFKAINMDTGEECQFIANAMLASTLREAYPGDAYVGKYFSIVPKSVGGKGDQKYTLFNVTELEPETGGETEVAENAPAGKRK